MTIQTPTQSKNRIQGELNNLEKELNANADQEKLFALACRIMMLLLRRSSVADKKYILDSQVEIMGQIKQLKGTYNSWTHLSANIASASLQIAGGLLGFSPLVSSAQSATTLAQVGKGLGPIGQGVSVFGAIAGTHDEGRRRFFEYQIEKMRNRSHDRQESARNNSSKIAEFSSTLRQSTEKTSQMFAVVAGQA